MEANDMEAMREALAKIYELMTADCPADEVEIANICFQALSSPARNCDIGTVDEQAERHKAYCRKHYTPDQIGGNCRKCPLKDRRLWSCQLAWAQMPYETEKGDAK